MEVTSLVKSFLTTNPFQWENRVNSQFMQRICANMFEKIKIGLDGLRIICCRYVTENIVCVMGEVLIRFQFDPKSTKSGRGRSSDESIRTLPT